MINLSPFSEENFEQFISWINNEELLITIAGNYFSYPVTEDQLTHYLNDEKSISFNIVDEEQQLIIGHAELINVGNDCYKIDKLIIGDQSQRGKGIGKQVMQLLVDFAFKQLQAKKIELNVFDWNANAIRCYEQVGFIINEDKTAKFTVADKTWIALNMSLSN